VGGDGGSGERRHAGGARAAAPTRRGWRCSPTTRRIPGRGTPPPASWRDTASETRA
jgi:hypothetical protein